VPTPGRRILAALADHGRSIGATGLLLETGVRNTAAISLFESDGYVRVASYVPSRDGHINRAFTKRLGPALRD
jgi:ribosomal protein S18 acetylase RimI-like enzyme